MINPQDSNAVLTVPNLISFLRLLGVGVFWWVLINLDDPVTAGWLIFVIGWTDWIDGFLARRLNQVSQLGKALDPIADRLMIASAVVGGLMTGVIPVVIGWGLIAREGLMAVLAWWLWRRGGGQLEVRWIGKLSTFILYGAIPAFYLAAGDTLSDLLTSLAWIFGILGLVLYWLAAGLYVGDARGRLAALELPHEGQEAR